jgi:hypothetical protein
MAQVASPHAETGTSNWFSKYYPESTPDEMADYYRKTRAELPLIAVNENTYGAFYGRMTGHTTEKDGAPLAANSPDQGERDTIPGVAVAVLLGLLAVTAATFVAYLNS